MGGVAQAFNLGGQGYANQVAPLASIFGAVESLRVPQDDGITHISSGYRRYGDATRSHVGADLSLSDDITLWLNTSWVSQNEWIPGESNDDGLPFSSYLNSPKMKYRAGA